MTLQIKNESIIRQGETSIYIAIYEIIGLIIIFIFNYLTPKSDCIKQAKKRLRDLESVKVIKSDIKGGTDNLTLSYKNRFGFKEQITLIQRVLRIFKVIIIYRNPVIRIQITLNMFDQSYTL